MQWPHIRHCIFFYLVKREIEVLTNELNAVRAEAISYLRSKKLYSRKTRSKNNVN